MEKHDNDALLGHIARQYQETAGEALHAQRQALDQTQEPLQWYLDRMDADVKMGTEGANRRRIIRIMTAAAAALVLIVLVPLTMQLFRFQDDLAATADSQAEMEVIPLSFDLPENLSVSGVTQDQDMSVYYLDNTELDPVVMQLESSETAQLDTQTLIEVAWKGRSVYAASEDGYQLLTFEHDSIIYTLTCAHDINTLTAICDMLF